MSVTTAADSQQTVSESLIKKRKSAGTEPARRALPGWAVDRIRTGVPGYELRAHGGTKAVNGALVSTAMSALQAGHGWPEWHGMLCSVESNLGRQARLDKRRRDIGTRRHLKLLQSAWRKAETNIAESPAFTSRDVSQRARGLLDDDPMIPWTATGVEADRLVYRHALAEAEQRGHTRPTLPIRGIAEATGVPARTAARSLHRLTGAGLLRLHAPGQRSAESTRAGVYVVIELTHPNRPLVLRTLCATSPDTMCHSEQTRCATPQTPCPTTEETTHA